MEWMSHVWLKAPRKNLQRKMAKKIEAILTFESSSLVPHQANQIWFQQGLSDKVVITRCRVQYEKCFPRFSHFAIYFLFFHIFFIFQVSFRSCKKWEIRKIFPMLYLTPCGYNYMWHKFIYCSLSKYFLMIESY